MKAKEKVAVVWFRNDLRLDDHLPLSAAIDSGLPVIPLYILEENPKSSIPYGGASRWWLHHSLRSLSLSLESMSSGLVLRRGSPVDVLKDLEIKYEICGVHSEASIEPAAVIGDRTIKEYLASRNIQWITPINSLLFDVRSIKNMQGKPYQVFTPFYNFCRSLNVPLPIKKPSKIKSPLVWPKSDSLKNWSLLPEIAWDKGIQEEWTPGEEHAQKKCRSFLNKSITAYDRSRDVPGDEGTSRLSPHLHFGEISPRRLWNQISHETPSEGTKTFQKELIWREFAYHLLYHFPHTVNQPLRPAFAHFSWKENSTALRAWQKGMTGIPIVDAGMRQLWKTGWMHNRVRMIVASFLVKNLLISWTSGAEWFWDTLVDADLANNTFNWQWAAGCGADAAPFFRIFNPVRQGEKFDPEGFYVKAFVPELKAVPARWIHHPWDAPEEVLRLANVKLGTHYPDPIVSLELSRRRALEAYQSFSARV